MKDLKEKYLPDLLPADSFKKMDKLTSDLNVKDNIDDPQSFVKNILTRLSAKSTSSSAHTILVVDEVRPMSKKEESSGNANWSSLKRQKGVDFIIALCTFSAGKGIVNVIPPRDKSVLCQRLTTPHRNSSEIATLLKFTAQHFGTYYLSGTELDKKAEHLPPGRLPIRLKRSWKVTDAKVLECIKENYVAESNLSVTVLCDTRKPSAEAEAWCGDNGWRYLEGTKFFGSEDQCVVLVDLPLQTEYISRARNLLVIVNTIGKFRWESLSHPFITKQTMQWTWCLPGHCYSARVAHFQMYWPSGWVPTLWRLPIYRW